MNQTSDSLASGKRAAWRFMSVPVVATALVGLALTAFLVWFAAREESRADHLQFDRDVETRAAAITAIFHREFQHGYAVRSLYAAVRNLSGAQFDRFMERQTEQSEGVLQTSLIARVKDVDVPALIESLRSADPGGAPLRIVEIGPNGERTAARSRAIHYPALFRWSPDSQQLDTGFDLASNPAMRNVMDVAWTENRPFVNYLYDGELFDRQGEAVFSIVLPLSQGTKIMKDAEIGTLLKVDYLLQALLDQALDGLPARDIDLYFETGAVSGRTQSAMPLVWSPAPGAGAKAKPLPRTEWDSHWNHSVNLDIHGAPWRVTGVLTRTPPLVNPTTIAALLGGLLLTVLSTAFVAHLIGSRRTIENQVAVRTSELSSVNAVLSDKQRELEEANVELFSAKEEAVAAAVAKMRFLATMGHELRTPLNGMIGITELLRETNLDPMQHDYVRLVRQAGSGLAHVLDNVLTYAQFNGGKGTLDEQPVEIASVVEDVKALAQADADAKHLALSVKLAPDLPRHVRIDGLRLQQILYNLVHNGIKFTTVGEVSIEASASPLGDEKTLLCLVVRDTGIGVTPDMASRIFDPFFSVETGLTRRHEGAGLGLAVVTEILSRMGGAIHLAESFTTGTGAAFIVEIPVTIVADAAEKQLSKAAS